MKRTREVKPLDWEEYVPEEVVHQFRKMAGGPIQIAELQCNWHYEYVVGWLYNVCRSFYSAEESKAMWADVSFDEVVLMQDVRDTESDENLYTQIREHILQTMSQNKNAQLKEWDVAVKYNLAEMGGVEFYTKSSAHFSDLTLREQFDVLYRCIKFIERRNPVFRNYVTNHLHLFQFPQCVLSESSSLLLLPGGKIVEKTSNAPEDNSLHVPIKLQNCTVRREDEFGVEVIHLDFGPDIDAYLSRIKLHFNPIVSNWTEFIDYLTEVSDEGLQKFLVSYLPSIAEHELHSRRLLQNRERERSMAELLVRRKRSSRLVAREEETQRRELESRWLEKLDERDQYIRSRQRIVAKHTRAIKDTLWSILWDKFEQDVKVEKLKRRTESALMSVSPPENLSTPEPTATADPNITTAPQDATPANGAITTNTATAPAISVIDNIVLEQGEKFHQPLIVVDPPLPEAIKVETLELPDELLITRDELTELANHGVPVADYEPDTGDWFFQCPCNIVAGANLNENEAVKNQSLVCCESCLRWQHWECQQESWLAILSLGHAQNAQTKSFPTVSLGNVSQRRVSRRQHSEEPASALDERPISKKPSLTQSEPFVCAWCMRRLEADLRNVFIPELIGLRAKQRKQHEDRERRKKLKEEKRLMDQQSPQQPPPTTIVSFTTS